MLKDLKNVTVKNNVLVKFSKESGFDIQNPILLYLTKFNLFDIINVYKIGCQPICILYRNIFWGLFESIF